MDEKTEKQKETSPVSFVRKPAKQGEYYIFSIPKALIDSGKVIPNKMYNVIIEPIKEEKEENQITIDEINGEIQVNLSEKLRSRLKGTKAQRDSLEKAIKTAIVNFKQKEIKGKEESGK